MCICICIVFVPLPSLEKQEAITVTMAQIAAVSSTRCKLCTTKVGAILEHLPVKIAEQVELQDSSASVAMPIEVS